MNNSATESGGPLPPLPVTIVPGMLVCEMAQIETAVVAGITQAYCVYRAAGSRLLQVARWRDLALVNVCPAAPLLPAEPSENDRRNAMATALRELLLLQQVAELTPAQSAALGELEAALASD
jgi:hypothetical protein